MKMYEIEGKKQSKKQFKTNEDQSKEIGA